MTDLIPPRAESGSELPVRDKPYLVALDDPRALDPTLVGGKAASLARGAVEGLRTLPGVVLTTAACEAIDAGIPVEHLNVLDEAAAVAPRVVARSSSVVEDMSTSSAAGQFESVIGTGIGDTSALADAVRTVLASRSRAGADDHPIAVLVQPFVEPRVSGVLFGIDPVSGRSDRMVITAVDGQPEPLVSGAVDGARHTVDREGHRLDVDVRDGHELKGKTVRSLVDLATRAEEVFGAPQDIEWAEVEGELLVLQSRPVTTAIHGSPAGPVYGPGPVAETFPERLRPLEADLWVPPLRDGVREALHLAGAVSDHALDGPDLVIELEGWVAIDLERTGEIVRRKRPPWFAIATRLRRLRAAWRVGRLRSALPALADRLIDRVDDDLESIPSLDEMTDRQLVALLGRGRAGLRSLHAHEILMGLLTDAAETKLTAASVAMRVLAEARTDGRSDADIVAQSPVVLALTAPRIGPGPDLPPRSNTPDLLPGHGSEPAGPSTSTSAAISREALRLRARWVQELTGRAAWTLGQRLERDGRMPDGALVPFLTYEELTLLVTRRVDLALDLLAERRQRHDAAQAPPFPARFRVSDLGRPIAERRAGESGGGTGASAGEATGPVTHDSNDPPAGSILVVRTLSPGIGPLLTRLAGVVSETGSVLAHLAILAREAGVPAVVGHLGALDEFAEGTVITVDGTTGCIRRLEQEEQP